MKKGRIQTNGSEDKLITVHKTLHAKQNIDRLYVKKIRSKRIANIEDNEDTSIRRLDDFKKGKERQMTMTRNNTDNIKKNRKTVDWK